MSSTDVSPTATGHDIEKEEGIAQPSDISTLVRPSEDPEKDDIRAIVCRMGGRTVTTGSIDLPVEQGRPDVATLIREAVKPLDKEKRVLIAACGPDGLMKVVRNTTASLISADGPALELHCEQFGW